MADYALEPSSKSKTILPFSDAAPSILFRAFIDGEEFFYQAPTAKIIDAKTFLVYVHKTSYILEHLRLFGKINVKACFSDRALEGDLSLYRAGEGSCVMLSFSVSNEIEHEERTEPCIVPMT